MCDCRHGLAQSIRCYDRLRGQPSGSSNNPSRGELVIFGENTRMGSGFCSTSMGRNYIQHVVDMQTRD